MHLVVDASVPEHVRNDIHPLGPIYGNYEYWISSQHGEPGSPSEDPFIQTYLSSPFLFDTAILQQPVGDALAPVPIARLMDTDAYRGLETGPNVTLTPAIGIAEFANANFFSEDTGSGQYPFPDIARLVEVQHPAPKTSRARRYFKKGAGDGLLVDPALAECVLDEAASADGALEPRTYTCVDENVWAQTAQAMLPRAVGYARGVLDYFYRGKLDLALDVDVTDAGQTLWLLTGKNGLPSDDLVSGTLTLYADDPTTGERGSVPGATSILVGGIAPGGDLFFTPPSFPATPQDAERSFLAVYKGTLGQEVAVPNQDPSRDFPGGVIGKVVGGVRVEEVFLDGAQWKLRTPKGVFLLPGLTTATFEDVRWGDGDNLLVARTSFGLGQPNRFVAYEIQRQAGSVEPVTTTPAGGLPEVLLSVKTEAIFPPDGTIDLGTTVNFTSAFASQELVGVYDVTLSKGADDSCNTAIGSLTVSTLNSPSATISGSFRVVLDLAHEGIFGTDEQPYVWYLQEVAATADGRLLGLVVVFLTTPEESATVSTASIDEEGNLVAGSQTVFGSFPSGVNPLLWALVDLQTLRLVTVGEIPVTTAKPSVTLTVRGVGTSLSQVYARVNDQCSGSRPRWVPRDLHPVFPQTPIAAMTPVSIQSAIVELTLQGWMKEELERLGLSSFELATSQGTGDSWYDCAPEGCYAIRFNGTTTYLAQFPRGLQDGRRSRPALAGERFAFVASVAFGFPDTVVGWDPGQGARVLMELPGLGESAHILGPVTGPAALVTTVGGGFANTVIGPFHIVSLDGSEPPTSVSNENFNFFTLLNPRFLYNASDLRFYRQRPSLQATVLPLKLSDLPDGSNPIGDYHAIRVIGGNALSLLP
jgi:hypothetical protein